MRPAARPKLKEFAVVWKYKKRLLDFIAVAASAEGAQELVREAVENGEDSKGNDLSWMTKSEIAWEEKEALEVESEKGYRKERVTIN